MMFQAIRPLNPAAHAGWLHELRNAVSTAGVATALSRRLLADDAALAADVLDEAELALACCRQLLAEAADHLQDASTIDVQLPPPPRRRRRDDPADLRPTRAARSRPAAGRRRPA